MKKLKTELKKENQENKPKKLAYLYYFIFIILSVLAFKYLENLVSKGEINITSAIIILIIMIIIFIIILIYITKSFGKNRPVLVHGGLKIKGL